MFGLIEEAKTGCGDITLVGEIGALWPAPAVRFWPTTTPTPKLNSRFIGSKKREARNEDR
ncbi:hypothetical protein WPS_32160 [Vulcanimicrobium alpinum]|uniref:Uncharacterized protein n=2 Tax=Vulcanimicrobium alpinum TaxID=3016050 RepID=A0AAN1XYY0_UNVUL|nr:hypothetical protein WPS_32160 [Vulcanimicrobium alpinum]